MIKYDDLMMRVRSDAVCDLPRGSDTAGALRRGRRDRVKLSDRLVNDLDAVLDETVTPDLGIPSYETLLGMLATGR